MLNFSANLSMLFTELPLCERFAAARAAGFKAVEIQFPYELPASTIRQLLDENQLELVLINVPADDLMTGGNGLACVPEKEGDYLAALEQAKEYVAVTGAKGLNILSGRKPESVSKQECFRLFEHNIKSTLDVFKDINVRILVEVINNIDMLGFLLHDLDEAADLCRKIPRLKVQYDCYHMARMERNVLAELEKHLPAIGHIQFADAPGRHEPGTGSINFDPIFRFLEKSDYAFYCGAEYRPSRKTVDSLEWFYRWQQDQR